MTWAHRINFNNLLSSDLTEMKEWCNNHCKGIWRCSEYPALYFQFDKDQDAMMFTMKFGGRGRL